MRRAWCPGKVYDYFGGMADVAARRVAFVRDPVQRIQEDYLRIFRYFRFYGRIAANPEAHEPATLDAIKVPTNSCLPFWMGRPENSIGERERDEKRVRGADLDRVEEDCGRPIRGPPPQDHDYS